MLPPAARNYVLMALEGTPDVLDALLQAFASNDPIWDLRPDPERFTLREMLAHLADWEPIFLERAARIRDEEQPFLPNVDEGELAITHNYAGAEPRGSLARFRAGRARLLPTLRALSPDAWERAGFREHVGQMTLENLAVMILGHDGYHARQAAQWLASDNQDA